MSFPTPSQPRYLTYRFRPDKTAEAIELIARARPGLTQYFVGKLLYFADKEHFLDWGRPITFDRYVAMVHGPVPSAVRNMLMTAAGVTAGIGEEQLESSRAHADALSGLVRVELEESDKGERQCVFSLSARSNIQNLSESDVEALEKVIRDLGTKSFGYLRDLSHRDEAWREAWGRAGGKVAPIDISLWTDPKDREEVIRQMLEYGATQ